MVTGILAAILAVVVSAFASFSHSAEQFPPTDPPLTTVERHGHIRERIRALREMIREVATLEASRQEPATGAPELTPTEPPSHPNGEAPPADGCRTHESSGPNWTTKSTVCASTTRNGSATASTSQSITQSSVTVRTGDSP